MEKAIFGLTGMAWVGGSRFCSDWNSLDWRKSVLTKLAWNGKSQVWPDWNSLEWRKFVLACLEWPGMEDVSFDPT
jgi:hypothetical protein